ncbi:MAG: M1 family aminopeptidase [Lentimicrobiaceae bacterium]|jgi:aminopeptidase N
MKTFYIRILFLLLLLTPVAHLYAQQEPLLKNLEMISESEKSAHLKLIQPHQQLIVNNYDLKYHRFFLFADPAQSYISGSVTSYFVATQPGMSSIQFELYSTMLADSAFHRGIKYSINHTDNVITVPLGSILPEGTLDSVTVYYHGNPTTSGFGSFGNEIHGGAPGMWTLSEPYGASDWWPSKNDLTDKIDSIDMFVVTPKGNHVASNGLLISETPYGTNSVLAHWKHRYPIASYLIAIASTNYARFSDYLKTGTDSLLVLNYVYPEDSASVRNNAYSVLESIALYENLFAPYPFRAEKYGHAEFGWGGGMEHQTMTFLGKGAFNGEIIAHELAHQWFGDMITCGSWHDIWLNEGFATYCAGLRYESLNPHYWYLWRFNNISNVCRFPGGSVYCDDTTNVNRIFDSRLSYSKGALLLHMLRWVVGDEKFFTGMKSYANDPVLRFNFARTSDFKKHIEDASGQDLTGFFADWFYGQGFPSYTINVDQTPDHATTVEIFQSQSDVSVNFFEMPVPIQFFGEGKDTLMVFNHTFSGKTFVTNPGFEIDSVKFDPELWLVSANNTISFTRLPADKLTLMPNPAGDFLYVQHNFGQINSLEIISMTGISEKAKLVKEEEYLLTIDTQELKSGGYLLRIGTSDGFVTRKFIIKK